MLAFDDTVRELDFRESDGISVRLVWFSDENLIGLDVVDSRAGMAAFALIPNDCASDAFAHPFAYVDSLAIAPQSLGV